MKKDELIIASELAKRLKVSAAYITKNKTKLKNSKCMYGNKYYFRKSAALLGKNPDDVHETQQKLGQQRESIPVVKKPIENTIKEEPKKPIEKKIIEKNIEKVKEPTKAKKETILEEDMEDIDDVSSLLDQIKLAIDDNTNIKDRALLDGLKLKATILKEYHAAKNEEIKSKKQIENLFDKDEILRILGFLGNSIRNALINLPNNYAVNLDGLNQKQIKDFVTEDINKILEQIQRTGENL